MSTIQQEQDTLVYQLFALSMHEEGAIEQFRKNLHPLVVSVAGRGHQEFYEAVLDFQDKTGLNTVDPVAFKSWLKNETLLHDALGGQDGVDSYFAKIDAAKDLSTPSSVIALLKYRYNRKKQMESLQELNGLFAEPKAITPEVNEHISSLADRIRGLNGGVGDPLSSVFDGNRIADSSDHLWELPDFLPTQFKALNEALGYSKESGGFCKGAVNAILAASGRGKPLHVDTLVTMGDATYKRLGDIKVGDSVLTDMGRVRRVDAVFEQGILQTLTITTKSGRRIVSAYDHTFQSKRGWTFARDLKVGDILYLLLGVVGFDEDPIVSIEPSEPAECRCITVKDDHTFLANDIIVHNSTLAKSLMLHWVEQGHKTLFINYEEARALWERVLFTQVTKQNVYKGHDLTPLERKGYTRQFEEKMREYGDRFMVKHDPDTPYFEDMEDWVREVAYRGEAPDVLILDTIQSMFLKSGKNLPRWGQYEEMMVRLEKLAKELNAVVLITAQENSNRMKEKREVVQQSDAGGSLAIVQKSSVTVFITPASIMTGDDSQDESLMQLQIPKNRITGSTFMMSPPMVKYNDSVKLYQDYTQIDQAPYRDKEIDATTIIDEDGGFY